MTTFTPPTEFGEPRGDAASLDLPDRLMSHYDPGLAGVTVWQDQSGVWHQSQFPYHGRPDSPGLAQSQRFFLGGHTYDIDPTTEAALISAGYSAYLNTNPVNHTWFKSPDVSKFTRWPLTISDPSATYHLSVDDGENLVAREEDGPAEFSSSNRNFWIHEDTAYNADFDASVIIDPTNYGVSGIAEQSGLVLRAQQSGGRNLGITINNNIFFVIPHCNIGVWSSDLDGSNFTNRQTNIPIGLTIGLPHRYDCKLEDNIITVRVGQPHLAMPDWDDPTFALTVNLDTDAGSVVGNPTPVGEGEAGLIAAHLGFSPLCSARYRGLRIGPRGSLFPEGS